MSIPIPSRHLALLNLFPSGNRLFRCSDHAIPSCRMISDRVAFHKYSRSNRQAHLQVSPPGAFTEKGAPIIPCEFIPSRRQGAK